MSCNNILMGHLVTYANVLGMQTKQNSVLRMSTNLDYLDFLHSLIISTECSLLLQF